MQICIQYVSCHLHEQDALHSDAARTEEKIELKGVLEGSEKQVH